MPATIACLFVPVTLVCTCIAVWLAWKRRFLLSFAALLPLGLQVLLILNAQYMAEEWEGVESVRVTPEVLIGTWDCAGRTVSLEPDGTFVRSDGQRGRWKLQATDCYVWVSRDQGWDKWVVLQKYGEPRLLGPVNDSDPDEWNLHRACSRRR